MVQREFARRWLEIEHTLQDTVDALALELVALGGLTAAELIVYASLSFMICSYSASFWGLIAA